MIKFFRQIRQSMINQNRTKKYLLYAIGEIILVVIGILIALQINNWNENRKARAIEINYLKNIKNDLNQEVLNNKHFEDFRFSKVKAASYLLNTKEPQSIEDAKAYVDNYETVFRWNTFVPNNNTFKELLSSGKLSLITNDSIKNQLLELDKFYADISINEDHMRREFQDYLYDIQIYNTSGLDFFDNADPNYGAPKRLSLSDIPDSRYQKIIEDSQWLFNDQTFGNGLKLAILNNGLIAKTHKDLDEDFKALISLIEEEILIDKY
ncbi:DUF6090 family protein [Winogradskyella ursingii]|uniref:DUF6090 family protein n=1 Tax=Winogradskyella ursingii TaxID=2686079 RepID=UPI0015CA23E7|nr:DUF6090 family protein [Winogradskyella ursingii]